MTREMRAAVVEQFRKYHDVVSISYPGRVLDGRPAADPHNLGSGWVGLDFAAAFGRPVLGSYKSGKMLFLGWERASDRPRSSMASMSRGAGASSLQEGHLQGWCGMTGSHNS